MPFKKINSLELPNKLTSPIFINDMGIPRYWVCIWQVLYAQNLAPSSTTKKERE